MTEDYGRDPSQTVTDNLRCVILSHLPLASRDQGVHDSTRIGPEGAGLDSVAIVELLLACEEVTGIPFTADVLADGPLTIGHLVRHAQTQTRPGGARANG